MKPRRKEDDYGCQLKQEEEDDGDEQAGDVVELMRLRQEEVAHLPAAIADGKDGFRRRPWMDGTKP